MEISKIVELANAGFSAAQIDTLARMFDAPAPEPAPVSNPAPEPVPAPVSNPAPEPVPAPVSNPAPDSTPALNIGSVLEKMNNEILQLRTAIQSSNLRAAVQPNTPEVTGEQVLANIIMPTKRKEN